MSITFEPSRYDGYTVYDNDVHVANIVEVYPIGPNPYVVEDVTGKRIDSGSFDVYSLTEAKKVARKYVQAQRLDPLAPITRYAIQQVNAAFRLSDESHLAPINGRFNATERAIRRLAKVRRYQEFSYVTEYMAALESEISRVVNGEY